MKFFHDKNLSPGAINEMGSLGSILACTVAGMGSALFTRSYLERFPEATEHLHLMQLPASERYMKIRMVWKKTRYLIPALKEFVSIFKV
jgi:DNA-binding transcriptional LysR family regulator